MQDRFFQQVSLALIKPAMRMDFFCWQPGIQYASACLPFTCLQYAPAHSITVFARGRLQLLPWHAEHVYLQINTIQQGSGDALTITLYLIYSAATSPVLIAEKAAGARVHGRDQLETRGEYGLTCGTGNSDAAGLHRLSQGFECLTLEFRQFIEK